MSEDCEALVVGGGLAGGAVATLLAEAGRRVVLLERTRGPHDKVCGEFLSAEALQYLELLRVDVGALGALPIATLRFTRGRKTTEEMLPFAAMSLTRRVLDEALLARAVEAGAVVCRGAAVESLVASDGGWVATCDAGGRYAAPAAFLATGKHDLRGHARPAAGRVRHGGLLGFNMYFRLRAVEAEALRGAIEVYLFRGGYCGLQAVEDGTANLGLLVRREAFGTWAGLMERVVREVPLLGERLAGAMPTLAKPLALSGIPYGFRRITTAKELWAVGDQAAVIPSFSGDGMSIALHSGVRAARMFLAGRTAGEYQRELGGALRTPVTLATMISRMLVGAPGFGAVLGRVPGVMREVALRTRVPLG